MTDGLRGAAGGSAACIGVAVTLVACAVDPAVDFPHVTPKYYALLLLSAAAALLWAVRARHASMARLHLTAIDVTLAVSIAWSVIATLLAPGTATWSWIWLPVAAFVLAVAVRQRFNPPVRDAAPAGPSTRATALADLMTALWIVGSALALHAVLEALGAGGARSGNSSEKTLMTSLIGSANGFGAFMATGIIAALTSAAAAGRRLVRVLLVVAALLQLAALIGNGSRGALLSLVAAALCVLWLRRWMWPPARSRADRLAAPRRRALGVVMAGLVAVAALAVAGGLLHQLNPASGRGRFIAWEVSAAMLSDRPLAGVGTGRFAAEWGRYQVELWRHPDYAEFDRQAVGRSQPNSELFHRLAEQGLPGGILYVLLWAFAIGFPLRALRRGERPAVLDWGLLALLVALLVHSLLDGSLRWEATLLTAHLAFGLVPAPALLHVDLRQRRIRRLAMATAVAWAATVAIKTVREYPGYQIWRQALRAPDTERLDLLVRAQRRLPWQPDLQHDLGMAMFRVGRLEEAAELLAKRLEARDNAPARVALAEAQLRLGWLGPAEANAHRTVAGYPDRLAPRLLLARIHHARGEEAQARAALLPGIRRDTYFRSAAVDSVAAEAAFLWRSWYDDEPPR